MPELEPITREEMLLDGQDLEPITRKEMFIKRIYDKTQVVPEPITREEMFLKKAGDETTDVTIELLNVSANGTYSESGKAYSPVIVNVPAPPIPDNAYLLNEVEGLPSDIATFTDGSNLPMPKLQVGIEPIQEGSGDPSPSNVRPISGWNGANVSRTGKNLFNPDTQGIVNARCTATDNDGIITITARGADCFIGDIASEGSSYSASLGAKQYVKPNTTYYLKVSDSRFNKNFISFFNKEGVCLSLAPITDSSTLTTPSNCCFVTLRYGYKLSTSGNVFTITIQLEEGNQATTYEPYNGHTYTIQFRDGDNPLTVYGGSLDVVSGELVVDRVEVDLGTVDWNKHTSSVKTYFRTITPLSDAKKSDNQLATHNLKCSNYKEDSWTHVVDSSGYDGNICIGWLNNAYIAIYDSRYVDASATDFKTAMNGVQLVYELATPITYQLTPTQVKSILGSNNVWADTGKIEELEYFSKEV